MLKTSAASFALIILVSLAAVTSSANEFILKVHHFLPATSPAQKNFIEPWCAKIEEESNSKLKCQIYPSMQLGGKPNHLYDQVKDGIVDIVWTIPSYTAGRFPLVEAFELPFIANNARNTSMALWKYVNRHATQEFSGIKPLAFHTHGGGVFHMITRPIKTAKDLRGLKIRAPTRQTNRMLAMLGVIPVGMPAPQIPEALSKGVIDGALLPYEVVSALKADELTKYHSEVEKGAFYIYTTVFLYAMNIDTYNKLPKKMRKIIDNNSGLKLSELAGRVFEENDVIGRSKISEEKINTIEPKELKEWEKNTNRVIEKWIKEINKKGYDGAALVNSARQLILEASN